MKFKELLNLVGNDPLFESSLLLAGDIKPEYVKIQLTRWEKAGRIIQLRRGLYTIAPPYQKTNPHPFVIANHLRKSSYVSCQSALTYYDLIPEYVPQTISVTGGRPGIWKTQLGIYRFYHIKPKLLLGYRETDLGDNQKAFIATPEKALLDLIYLQPDGDNPAYLKELRLQNLDMLNIDELYNLVTIFNTPKLLRAFDEITKLAQNEKVYKTL